MLTELLPKIAYWLAAMMMATFPAAILFWCLIHPFASFWRRRGPALTYAVVGATCLAVAVLLFRARDALLGPHLGTRWPLVVLGLAIYGVAIGLEIACRRHLKSRILVGVPELSEGDPGQLLTDGIYSRTRNPRYLSILIGIFGWTMVFNYRGLWVLSVLLIPAFYLVIFLEEQELKARLGEPYREYLRSVPRLFPIGKAGRTGRETSPS